MVRSYRMPKVLAAPAAYAQVAIENVANGLRTNCLVSFTAHFATGRSKAISVALESKAFKPMPKTPHANLRPTLCVHPHVHAFAGLHP